MLSRIRTHASFANVVSLMALFVALSGTAYAAVKLPKNSVGARQIKKNGVKASEVSTGAIGSSEVKNGSLRLRDFRASDVPAGERGLPGERGPAGTTGADGAPGAPGTARAFARVGPSGALVGGETQSKGITATMVQHEDTPATNDAANSPTGIGIYCFGGLGFTPTSATVALDNTDSLPAIGSLTGGSLNFVPSVALFKGEDLGRCNSAHGQVRVAVEQVNDAAAPTLANHGFIIWFEG
jgi:hypothetical protein